MADFRKAMRVLREGAVDLLYPSGVQCLCCGAAASGRLLCPDCDEALGACRLTAPRCPVCAEPMQGRLCPRCQSGWRLRGASVWFHRGPARQLVEKLKWETQELAADVLAPGLAGEAERLAPGGDTVITWVPMRPEKMRERGIDHARLLAEKTAYLAGLRCEPLLVNRGSLGDALRGQARSSRAARESRTLLFTADGPVPDRVLLVDDVLTTGATCQAAAAALQARGAEVAFLTATRAVRV